MEGLSSGKPWTGGDETMATNRAHTGPPGPETVFLQARYLLLPPFAL